MGQSASTHATTSNEKQVYSPSPRRDLSASELLASLASSGRTMKAPSTTNVDLSSVQEWDAKFTSDPKAQLASTVLNKQDILSALVSRKAIINDPHVYNVKLSTEGKPVTNQKSSGRCWLFAATTTIRIAMARKYNLDEFQLSQSYLFFYDSLEKANYFLMSTLNLADEPLDSRVLQYLFTAPENDGGQWDMVVSLIEKYGLVPQSIYPESFNSSNTGKLDGILTRKLRDYALELRASFASSMRSLEEVQFKTYTEKKELAIQATLKLKEKQMAEVYRILAIALGAPPKPDESFTWEYYSADKKFHSVTATPIQFYKSHSTIDVGNIISLINDPRNAYDTLYTVQHLGNVWEGRPVLYVNTQIENLKKTAIALLKADIPVWFGCDVGKSSNSGLGLMDEKLYDIEGAFGTDIKLNKAERLQTGDSSMTHAMTLTAVHLDENGNSVRWRVENSWGDAVGDKGWFLMTDKWFDEYVFQVVADKSKVPRNLVDVFEKGNAVELPPWDPMGSLA